MSTHDNNVGSKNRNEKVADTRLDNPVCRILHLGHTRTSPCGLQICKPQIQLWLAISSDRLHLRPFQTGLPILGGETREATGERDLSREEMRDCATLGRLTVSTVFQILITLPLRELSSVLEKKPRRVAINGARKGGLSFSRSLFPSLSLSNNQNAARWLIPPLMSPRRT